MFPHMLGEFRSQRLPALATPRTFEVAARYQNFSRAAGVQLPAFATHWLIPRLADFGSLNPDIHINIRASPLPTEFAAENVDRAARYDNGKWPGVHAVPLADEDVFPVYMEGKHATRQTA